MTNDKNGYVAKTATTQLFPAISTCLGNGTKKDGRDSVPTIRSIFPITKILEKEKIPF